MNTRQRIVIAFLISALLVGTLINLRNRKKAKPLKVVSLNPEAATVGDRITEGYLDNMSQLTGEDVKKYGDMLTKAELLASRFLKTAGNNVELGNLLNAISAFDSENFRTIVLNWAISQKIDAVSKTALFTAKLNGSSQVAATKFRNKLLDASL